ncbi:MAG: flagellar assembly protein FliW [Sulfurimonas sp.]|jgi:flagellar assembly factor FliW|nr:flagellar assembly protein FliW [Sulfurimonas sp.]
MKFTVKKSILGFENIQEVEIVEIDEMFATMRDANNKDISFTIVNPYTLREYSFDVSKSVETLLDINEKSNISVYNIVVIKKPLEDSCVNFLAPIIVNNDTKELAQDVLNSKDHPDFGMAETIKSFQ